ncbi:MAG TPA: Isoquinoline 1-oxidoreductase subunit [Kofleriaceae bacterium]
MRTSLVLAAMLIACGNTPTPQPRPVGTVREPAAGKLRGVADFNVIADRSERSRALFAEASRVLLHPRCVNCHPAGDVPHQGMRLETHDPPVVRGPDNHGVPGNGCTTCHQDRNQELTRVPGAPGWHLAPIEMAWVGKSAAQLCAQLQDRQRNGGKTLAQIVEHSGHDPLVAWGWSPGHGREPAPGTQAEFGALMAAWAETGAQCPEDKP